MMVALTPLMAHTHLSLRYFTHTTLHKPLSPHFTLAAAMSSSASATSPSTTATSPSTTTTNPDPLVQYVVLRRDLVDKWPLGSVVTQGCHAAVAAVWTHRDDPHTQQYCLHLDSMHKVTLEVKGETQLLNLMEKLKENSIDHKLWIEQPENIPTCLATKPYPKSIVSSYFKRLKLCK